MWHLTRQVELEIGTLLDRLTMSDWIEVMGLLRVIIINYNTIMMRRLSMCMPPYTDDERYTNFIQYPVCVCDVGRIHMPSIFGGAGMVLGSVWSPTRRETAVPWGRHDMYVLIC